MTAPAEPDVESVFDLDKLPFDRYAHKNPALSAVILHGVASGYERRKARGVAVPWAMLAIPYLAAEGIRDKIPKGYNASLRILLDNHPQWQAQNAEALRGAAKFFWPALRLGVARGVLTLRDGRVSATRELQRTEVSELNAIYAVADKFGRFLGKEAEESLPNLFNLEVIR